MRDSEGWARLVFVEGLGVTESEACSFTVTRDGERDCLVIGPWRAGEWSARWQWMRPFGAATGMIRGKYRTEGVLPFTADASCAFLKGRDRLRRDGVLLAPAKEWTAFEVAVRRPPPGADGVSPAFGLSGHTEGRVFFADLEFDPAPPRPVVFPGDPPRISRSAPPSLLPAGGRYRMERSGDTWWLVSPDGNPFYSIGTDVPGFRDAGEGEKLAAMLRGYGFNSLGGWSDIWRWGRLNGDVAARGGTPFAVFHAIETTGLKRCGRLADPADKDPPGDHAFPDPYDPAFIPAYRDLVNDAARAVAGKPWFAGWFLDNERDHERLDRRVWSGYTGREFRRWLKVKYRTVGSLNAAWGASFASFDAMARAKPVAGARQGALYDDCRAFARQVVRHYAGAAVSVLRRADPGALVFTNRFMMGGIVDTLGYLDLYDRCDGIAVNLYPANRSPGLSANERAILEEIHRRTGKPLLIGEWSVPSLDSGLYDDPAKLDWSYPEAVDTQSGRAAQAALVTAEFHGLPFVVGAHWFTWRDFDSAKRRANRGLVRAGGEPWRELLDALAAVHGRMTGARQAVGP